MFATRYIGGIRAAFSLIGFLLIWEMVVRALALPGYVLPTVSAILEQLWRQQQPLIAAAMTTSQQALLGFGIGATVGVALAVALTFTGRLRDALLSIVVAINIVPMIAYAPLVVLWFGVGMESKVIIVACEVGFTVLLGTLDGLNRVDKRSVDLLRSFGAGPFELIRKLRLPSALPSILTALKLSTVRSIIATIVVEMLGAYQGLGWTIFQSVVMSDFLTVWAAILVASLLSLAFFGLLAWLERRLVFWQ